MKHFIIAAGLMLIAAPAFAGSVHDAPKSDNKAVTFTDAQVGGYASSNPDSAIARRNANLRRAAQERSSNARAAWQGSVHYY